MAVDHYENFPVASILMPRHLRGAVVDIYRFARSADDIADEGDATPQTRLQALDDYRAALDRIAQDIAISHAVDTPTPNGGAHGFSGGLDAVFVPLRSTIRRHRLPLQPFYDLLSAFSQDVQVTRYPDDEALFDYCRRSANPVGRLMLHLYDAATSENLSASDAICTGLQLTNFWQDVAIDWQKSRVYLPQAHLQAFGVTETQIAEGQCDAAWRALMRQQVAQARSLLNQGRKLPERLPGRLALELRMIIEGGLRILERLDDLNYDIFNHRPTLKMRDWLVISARALARRKAPNY
ncbi:squalene synthase HpnC [Pusillimonas sp. NJUB218]|uniref:squalene synthase HpnC n=1 Tax=Pusillimonas sp. NJUB218 TaxID=2023230 RepID=UPI000F4B4C38|nr:squalene synthase HpnC [Pusillimonas sp. NJUB218]ROT46169.1 squalene synthase HpnC [Pusillimonas sp. NJUB218]